MNTVCSSRMKMKRILKEQIDDLFREINMFADMRNCVVDDMTLTNERTGKSWNEYDGGWYE